MDEGVGGDETLRMRVERNPRYGRQRRPGLEGKEIPALEETEIPGREETETGGERGDQGRGSRPLGCTRRSRVLPRTQASGRGHSLRVQSRGLQI